MRAHRSMLTSALVAEENTDVRAAPFGVLASTVKANLVLWQL